jgi:HAD superfamily phosphoserine phosphatase-like hydrolase
MVLHYIDFDGTLVRSNALHYLIHVRLGLIAKNRTLGSWLFAILFFLGLPVILLLHLLNHRIRDRFIFFFYRGADRSDVDLLMKDFWQKNRQRFVRKEVEDIIRYACQRGEAIVMASGSLRQNIEPLLQELGFPASSVDYVTAELEFRPDGSATGFLLDQPNIGAEKLRQVQRYERSLGISPSRRTALSDSFSDLPLLDFCDDALVVSPDAKLKATARLRQWRIVKTDSVQENTLREVIKS